jgi:hypothetical protein
MEWGSDVRWLDFQDTSSIKFDLDRDMALRHRSDGANRYIVASIAADRHRVRADDPAATIAHVLAGDPQ